MLQGDAVECSGVCLHISGHAHSGLHPQELLLRQKEQIDIFLDVTNVVLEHSNIDLVIR